MQRKCKREKKLEKSWKRGKLVCFVMLWNNLICTDSVVQCKREDDTNTRRPHVHSHKCTVMQIELKFAKCFVFFFFSRHFFISFSILSIKVFVYRYLKPFMRSLNYLRNCDCLRYTCLQRIISFLFTLRRRKKVFAKQTVNEVQ